MSRGKRPSLCRVSGGMKRYQLCFKNNNFQHSCKIQNYDFEQIPSTSTTAHITDECGTPCVCVCGGEGVDWGQEEGREFLPYSAFEFGSKSRLTLIYTAYEPLSYGQHDMQS
jgi:hypothetical protein